MPKIVLIIWLISATISFCSSKEVEVAVIQVGKQICNGIIVPYCKRNNISYQAGIISSMRNLALPGKMERRAVVSNSILQGSVLSGVVFDKIQRCLPMRLHKLSNVCFEMYVNHLLWYAPVDILTKREAALHHIVVPILHGGVSCLRGCYGDSRDVESASQKKSSINELQVLLKDSSQLALVAGVIQFIPSFMRSDWQVVANADVRLFSFDVVRQVLHHLLERIINKAKCPQVFNNPSVRWFCCIAGSFLISFFLKYADITLPTLLLARMQL